MIKIGDHTLLWKNMVKINFEACFEKKKLFSIRAGRYSRLSSSNNNFIFQLARDKTEIKKIPYFEKNKRKKLNLLPFPFLISKQTQRNFYHKVIRTIYLSAA